MQENLKACLVWELRWLQIEHTSQTFFWFTSQCCCVSMIENRLVFLWMKGREGMSVRFNGGLLEAYQVEFQGLAGLVVSTVLSPSLHKQDRCVRFAVYPSNRRDRYSFLALVPGTYHLELSRSRVKDRGKVQKERKREREREREKERKGERRRGR